jgi:hypothetical protein
MPIGLFGCVGGEHVCGDDHVWLGEHTRWFEVAAIEVYGLQRAAHVEMVSEGKRKSEEPGQLGAVSA